MGHVIQSVKAVFTKSGQHNGPSAVTGTGRCGTSTAEQRIRSILEAAGKRAGIPNPEQVSADLLTRFSGLALNLSTSAAPLKQDERRCLLALTPDEWKGLHAAAAAGGGEGVAYVELDADMLPGIAHGLAQLPNLQSVFAWVPNSGTMDFTPLQGRGGRNLQINLLGTPTNKLDIRVSEDVDVKVSASHCPAIWKSNLHRTMRTGAVQTLPLCAPPPLSDDARLLPCSADAALKRALVGELTLLLAGDRRFKNSRLDPQTVAAAIMRCARFDSTDKTEFGLDLNDLTPEQMRCVLALPMAAWSALQDSAARGDTRISWIDLRARRYVSENFDSLEFARPFHALLRMPCAADKNLLDTLVAQLREIAALPKFANQPFNPLRVAWELMLCGRIDNTGTLAFDLRNLSVQDLRFIHALPPQAWAALQRSAESVGLKITRVELPREMVIDAHLLSGMNELPLSQVWVSAPKEGIYVGLGALREGRASLRSVKLRPDPKRRFKIEVPSNRVAVYLPRDVAMDKEALAQSLVVFGDEAGRRIEVPYLTYTQVYMQSGPHSE